MLRDGVKDRGKRGVGSDREQAYSEEVEELQKSSAPLFRSPFRLVDLRGQLLHPCEGLRQQKKDKAELQGWEL